MEANLNENVIAPAFGGISVLEAFPNGDALKYADLLGRDVLRWPDHCVLGKTLVDLYLLDDEPAMVDGTPADRKRFLAAAIEPHIQYKAKERDVVVVQIEVVGRKDREKTRHLPCDR